ncbi:coiled-coil domain-containing protein [Enteractinococcus helveticum]|uniref:Uncharacterized protein n=1 Tax=Enteractinococcus helveticum TaxID=1837282 RepID=A0A1B7M1G1_9MICC|nr:hypothetical protein [Enteractinococcus helveticum]OAV62395.1 hypothetical protein A6F49_06715 [Enteractinococcus helveticum]
MSRVGRLVRGTGILTIAALGLSACGDTGFDQSAATKVIQSVDVNLDPAGAITEVASNAVYLDELSGKSNSNTDDYTVDEVVEDLPVRVSTQYTTDDDSGSNLEDLEGHTGRVEIAVTVENLTLNSTEVTYDVAGESRQSSALVGTPLSVAGSVELEDTTASNVVVDVESDNTTNGVVSQTTDGDAVVQWGTVLAPPQSEATTTFRLVADVEDFSTPKFDLAVQAGFHTDMSFEGMLTSTFDTSASSEYAMQQKAIELVADINEVLTRAGTTITEIRQNLDHTTDTLGVDAAQQLRQNSDDMVTEMQRVGEQLTALESQVEGSMSGAETAMNSQLSQIVASMNGMMGNTEATAPKLVTGQGCAATVEDAESNGSLYSTFLILGAQLDGYAAANAECRDEIVAGIQDTLGPEVPDQEVCKENGTSITCVLFAAEKSVLSSLDDLVAEGQRIADELENTSVDPSWTTNEEIGTKLETIGARFDDIYEGLDEILEPSEEVGNAKTPQKSNASGIPSPFLENTQDDGEGSSEDENNNELKVSDKKPDADEPVVTWDELTEAISSARTDLEGLQALMRTNRDDALEDLKEHVTVVRDDHDRLSDEADALSDHYHELAQEICRMELPEAAEDGGEEGAIDDRNRLSIQLVGTDCDDAVPTGVEDISLDERAKALVEDSVEEHADGLVEEQKAHWDAALAHLNADNEESAVGTLLATLTQLEKDILAVQTQTAEDTAQQIAEHEKRIEQIENETKSKVKRIKEKARDKISKVKKNARDEIDRINAEAEEEIERVETEAADEADRIKGIVTGLQENKDNIVELAEKDQTKLKDQIETLQRELKEELPDQIEAAFNEVTAETRDQLPDDIDQQVRVVTDRINNAQDAVVNSYNTTISGLATTSDAVVNDTAAQLNEQKASLEEQQGATTEALNKSTTNVLESIHQSTTSSTRDLEGASAQLGASLTNVILDLGDPDIQGSGILGSMSASSAMSDTADYQLALASQRAAGYANVRSEDIAEIMLRQAQFSASLEAAGNLPVFHLDVPSGARTQTIYAFHIGGDSK